MSIQEYADAIARRVAQEVGQARLREVRLRFAAPLPLSDSEKDVLRKRLPRECAKREAVGWSATVDVYVPLEETGEGAEREIAYRVAEIVHDLRVEAQDLLDRAHPVIARSLKVLEDEK